MKINDNYILFQERLDAYPSGAPFSPSFDEILHILFNEAEVHLAIHMTFMGNTAETIAEKASLPVDVTRTRLEDMADKVIIYSRDIKDKRIYGLLAPIPGLFEFQFMKGGNTPELERLSVLWDKYKHEVQAEAFEGKPTPLMRVVPVNKSLSYQNHVLPYDEVSKLIEQADYLALAQCACRVSMKKCKKPTDVCIATGFMAKFLVERGYAEEITKEKALNALDKAEKSGLVHCSNNSADGASVICNCCSCCCTVLIGRVEMNLKNSFAPSRYRAYVVEEECTGCGICIDERCPNKAIKFNTNEVASVNEEECIGCGLCVTGCPTGAMKLSIRTEEIDTPKTTQDLVIKVLKEKNKLDSFLKVMK